MHRPTLIKCSPPNFNTDFSSLSEFKRIIPLWTSLIIFIVSSLYLSYSPIATAMVLLYRFHCIFVYHVLVILDLYFASWAAVRA